MLREGWDFGVPLRVGEGWDFGVPLMLREGWDFGVPGWDFGKMEGWENGKVGN